MKSARLIFRNIAIFTIFTIPLLTIAAPLYQPGETLNPSCLPTDVDCAVATSTTAFATTSSDFWLTQQYSLPNLANIGSSTGTTTTLGGALFNRNVGIGTSTVSNALVVESSSPTVTKVSVSNSVSTGAGSFQALNSNNDNIEFLQYGRSAAGTYFGVDRAGGAFLGGSPNTLFGIGTRTDTPLLFATNNTEKIRVLSSGNVGIGTTSPYAKLSVVGDIVASTITATTTFNTSGTTGGYKIDGNLILQASSTNFSTLFGQGAGAALLSDGTQNTAIGYQSLNFSTSSDANTAIGHRSLYLNTVGTNNTGNGAYSLYSNTNGSQNTGIGRNALNANISGSNNTAVGYNSLLYNTTGNQNISVGGASLQANTTGSNNTANGYGALYSNISGSQNTANGMYSLYYATSTTYSTGIGYLAGVGSALATNDYNSAVDTHVTFIGSSASRDNNIASTTTIINSTAIGYNAKVGGSNMLVLGNGVNVGIGTTSPVAKLDIFNTISSATAPLFSIASSTNGAGTSTALYVNANGNVGIGTSTPTNKLTLAGGNFTHTASGNPTLAGTYDTGGNAYNVYVSGKYAYVADDTAGLQIIDISNSAAPTLTSTYDTSGQAVSVYVSGKYAYVADYTSGLQIIDISNPKTPSLTGTYNTTGNAYDVYVSGKYAYVADNASGLHIIDISNPAAPTLTGTYNTSGTAYGVYVSGKYAYVADDSAGLQIIDISTPATPTLTSTYNTTGFAQDVYISGKYAYVADSTSGLQVIDVSNPAVPALTSTLDTSGFAYGVHGSGKYVYVADYASGLHVVDISNPSVPTLTGTYNTTGSALIVYISGKYAYVADHSSGLQIIDINGIETPSLYAGNINTNALTATENIDVGNNLYVRNGLNVGQGGIFTDGFLTVAGTSSSSYFAGNIGIGTTSPYAKLSVTNTGTGPSFIVEDSASPDSSPFIIDADGNIGIGTSSPARKLHLEGSGGSSIRIQRTDSVTANGSIEFTGNDSGVDAVISYNNSIGSALTFNTGGSGLSNTRMTIDSTGNVGIGTTSPYAKLSVESLSTSGTLVGGDSLTGFTGKYLDFKIASTTQFNVDYQGRIYSRGQGASAFNLNVSGAGISGSSNNYYIPFMDSAGSCPGCGVLSSSKGLYINIDSNSDDSDNQVFAIGKDGLLASSTQLLTVLESGSVGIGSSTVYDSIGGTSRRTLVVQDNTNNAEIRLSGLNAILNLKAVSGAAYIGTQGEQSLIFQTNNASIARFTSTGNLGLGTTTPSSKLSITQGANTAAGGLWIAEAGDTDFRSIFMAIDGTMSFYGGDTSGALNTATLNSSGAWTNASDRSYKKNIIDLGQKYGLSTVLLSKPRFYEMKGNNVKQIGFIAQELEEIVPEVVEGKEGTKGISYGNLVAVAFQAIKDLNYKVEGMIQSMFVKELHVQEKLCVDDVCLDRDQLKKLLLKSGGEEVEKEKNDTEKNEIPKEESKENVASTTATTTVITTPTTTSTTTPEENKEEPVVVTTPEVKDEQAITTPSVEPEIKDVEIPKEEIKIEEPTPEIIVEKEQIEQEKPKDEIKVEIEEPKEEVAPKTDEIQP